MTSLHQSGRVAASFESSLCIKVQRLGQLVVNNFRYTRDVLKGLGRRRRHLALAEAADEANDGLVNRVDVSSLRMLGWQRRLERVLGSLESA